MKFSFYLSLILAVLPLISCSARINGSVTSLGQAALTLNMAMEPRMSNLIRTLGNASGSPAGNLIDGPSISKSMQEASGIERVSLKNTSPVAVEGSVQISKIDDFLASTGGGFITFRQTNAGGSCQININRGNGSEIISLLSPETEGYLSALMAPVATGEELTKKEYLELVASFYNKPISDEIAASRIRASIEFPGTVTSVKGGTFSGKKAEFNIALLDLLVLETPVNLEINWR